ncbi:hypothetical protein HPB47_013534 [Ixodes persulcatus]|uniref:Uncharacterized protein n=1 Tax=Ixodes persulcatus TaxID=34615 RepID=A0AC60QYA5_IXOPE|nr:hypothetical protein HPB47_013534 [Ixodes persulcatus]
MKLVGAEGKRRGKGHVNGGRRRRHELARDSVCYARLELDWNIAAGLPGLAHDERRSGPPASETRAVMVPGQPAYAALAWERRSAGLDTDFDCGRRRRHELARDSVCYARLELDWNIAAGLPGLAHDEPRSGPPASETRAVMARDSQPTQRWRGKGDPQAWTRTSTPPSDPDNGDLCMSNPAAMNESSSLDGDTDCSSLHESTQVWKSEPDLMIQAAQGEKLCLAVDGRADSPGHSADFGTYTLMDVNGNRVFHIELVKSTEVSSSYRMEKEGLVRAFTSLQKQGVEVGTIVTDRHREVNAYLRINHPDVQHRFDAWHFAKGIKKKIDEVSRTKAHEVLRKWKSTIMRHLYWCARTSDGDGDLALAKWKFIMRHVIDVHIHQDFLHPACAHGDIGNRKSLEEGKPSRGTCCSYLYLKNPHFCTGTETFRRLESVLMPTHLLRDIPRISPKEQTYALESFYGILVHFAPKSSKFKYEGMLAR